MKTSHTIGIMDYINDFARSVRLLVCSISEPTTRIANKFCTGNLHYMLYGDFRHSAFRYNITSTVHETSTVPQSLTYQNGRKRENVDLSAKHFSIGANLYVTT